MNTTYKSLNVRKGGVNGVPSWRKIAQMAQDTESTRRSNLANLPDLKPVRDAELEKIVFSDSEIGQIESELLAVWGEL